mmetsp:Transcript_9721/g.22139  ORF Transcript_9721/g.22139 Transcript_9721/m.22139 type:complete len:232 (+) Transcript_9721:613-1308(+)
MPRMRFQMRKEERITRISTATPPNFQLSLSELMSGSKMAEPQHMPPTVISSAESRDRPVELKCSRACWTALSSELVCASKAVKQIAAVSQIMPTKSPAESTYESPEPSAVSMTRRGDILTLNSLRKRTSRRDWMVASTGSTRPTCSRQAITRSSTTAMHRRSMSRSSQPDHLSLAQLMTRTTTSTRKTALQRMVTIQKTRDSPGGYDTITHKQAVLTMMKAHMTVFKTLEW